jgi:hypothetical protein
MNDAGYALEPSAGAPGPGRNVPIAFTITGPLGRPVTSYDTHHEKKLHLIAVRHDFTGYQHVHPELTDDGIWHTELDLTPGPWRLFADIKPTDADARTLSADLTVSGDYKAQVGPEPSRFSRHDGYHVTVAGDLIPGEHSPVTMTITYQDRPVHDLEPYLGAYGHLVALRAGDLAYLHVHPDGSPDDDHTPSGPQVVFHAAIPSPGVYHLYLDFQHAGTVHTAAFVLPTVS